MAGIGLHVCFPRFQPKSGNKWVRMGNGVLLVCLLYFSLLSVKKKSSNLPRRIPFMFVSLIKSGDLLGEKCVFLLYFTLCPLSQPHLIGSKENGE